MKRYQSWQVAVAVSISLMCSSVYASEGAGQKDGVSTSVMTYVKHDVKPGDTAYNISKKVLTKEQHKSLSKYISVSGRSLSLRPKDTVKFELNNGQLVSVEYGSAKKLKKVKIQSAKVSTVDAPSVQVAHDASSKRDSDQVQDRWLTVMPGDSVMKMADRAQLPKVVKASLLKHASKLKSIKPKDSILVSWSPKVGLRDVVLKRGSSIIPMVHHGRVSTADASVKPALPMSRDVAVSPLISSMKASQSAGYRMVSVRVKDNFTKDAASAGLPKHVIKSVSDLYQRSDKTRNLLKSGSSVDVVFKPDLKQFSVAYTKLSKGSQKHEAILYKTNAGQEYYDADGRPYQQSFLRIPLGQHRLSSSFSLKRKHPVTGRIKPHYGVDFAAKTGSPVWSSASGKVVFAGYQKGYGRVVKVQHSPNVTTLYAHLSRFDARTKVGAMVDQKQVIGFVGSSGVSTGPHLHYEYHINNQPRDPMTVALSTGNRLRNVDRVTMLAQRKQWLAVAQTTPSV